MFGYRIDFHFHEYKFTIEIDVNGHNDKIINYEIKRQKVIEQQPSCKFIRLNSEKEDFDTFKAINEISNNRLKLHKNEVFHWEFLQ